MASPQSSSGERPLHTSQPGLSTPQISQVHSPARDVGIPPADAVFPSDVVPKREAGDAVATEPVSDAELMDIVTRLRTSPYLGGRVPTKEDLDAFERLALSECALVRWIRTMESARRSHMFTVPRSPATTLLGAARAVRGTLVHFTERRRPGQPPAIEHFEDGVIVVDGQGIIMAYGAWTDLRPRIPTATKLDDYSGHFIFPGFVDCHVHYPQVGMIASDGEQLLDWLHKYTFPTEMKFADPQHATTVSNFFLDELLRQGTTTALVFATVHPQSVDAFFTAARQRRLRMICGKVLMDRDAPEGLLDTAERGYAESRALIERWHKQDRLLYAVTPRFAPTSTPEQLELAGKLLAEFPDVYMHTHLSENPSEVQLVQRLFPESSGYLDVYDRASLVNERSVFAHCVHLRDDEFDLVKKRDSAIAWCAMSNMFLGSGLFNRSKALQRDIRTGLGSDMGAGNSISVLCAMEASYKNEQLRNDNIDPISLFYEGTYGGAVALKLEDKIGNFAPGKEADFVVLDPRANPLLEMRMAGATELKEQLFLFAMLKGDRVVRATYVLGNPAYTRRDN